MADAPTHSQAPAEADAAAGLAAACPAAGYQHEAFFYAGEDEFLAGTLPFIRDAVAADEAILVVLAAPKIAALRRHLNGEAERVSFADMAEVGTNPARIIPAWQDFVDCHAPSGRRIWGIGEPVWAGRSAAELVECRRHEELLNVVFNDPAFCLLCPYDTESLDPESIDDARRSHPYVREAGQRRPSAAFPGVAALAAPFDVPLPEPPGPPAEEFVFHAGVLRDARKWVGARAAAEGLAIDRLADLLLAVNEVATNSLRHGASVGTVSVWSDGDAVVSEVRDTGRIMDPLVGRRRPAPGALGGRGLWIANTVCELVQIRTFATGNVVRLHMRRADSPAPR